MKESFSSDLFYCICNINTTLMDTISHQYQNDETYADYSLIIDS